MQLSVLKNASYPRPQIRRGLRLTEAHAAKQRSSEETRRGVNTIQHRTESIPFPVWDWAPSCCACFDSGRVACFGVPRTCYKLSPRRSCKGSPECLAYETAPDEWTVETQRARSQSQTNQEKTAREVITYVKCLKGLRAETSTQVFDRDPVLFYFTDRQTDAKPALLAQAESSGQMSAAVRLWALNKGFPLTKRRATKRKHTFNDQMAYKGDVQTIKGEI